MNDIIENISKAGWSFNNTYARLPKILLSKLSPVPVKSPKLIALNKNLSNDLGLDFSLIDKENLSLMFSGNYLPKGSETIAQAYAGHQFGHFTMLGDGRALMIGEHESKNKIRYDIQFKGSGATPYSRNADGRAALGPMLREYIISEAMYYLKIPTTRSLAVVTTGENITRENQLPGAILTRVALSHLRVGTFQYAAISGDEKILKILTDYAIERHYENLKENQNKALSLLRNVIKKQVELVTHWMRVGFIHGVMNTDNMTISGETIDYGPCAFMDIYNPETVFSSIDLNGRYAFFNQPGITKWNLARFAETLIPLIDKKKDKAIKIAEEEVNNFNYLYKNSWLSMMKKKIGLFGENPKDEDLIEELLKWMNSKKADFTNTFYLLMEKDFEKLDLFKDPSFLKWHKRWKERLVKNNKPFSKSIEIMKENNPQVIPRNYKVEEALNLATNDMNFNSFHDLLEVLKKPYDNQKNIEGYQFVPNTTSQVYKTYCGT
tara:strand:- start:730 stop:2208 length:1479 start_codon:yes stop_codon:yes gene_type:complete